MAAQVTNRPNPLGPIDFGQPANLRTSAGRRSSRHGAGNPHASEGRNGMTHQSGLRQHAPTSASDVPEASIDLETGVVPQSWREPMKKIGDFFEQNVPGWNLSEAPADEVIGLMSTIKTITGLLPNVPAGRPLPGPPSQGPLNTKAPRNFIEKVFQRFGRKPPSDLYTAATELFTGLSRMAVANKQYALGDIVNEYFDDNPDVGKLPEHRGGHFSYSVDLGIELGLSPEDAMKNAAIAHGLATREQLQPKEIRSEVLTLKQTIDFANLDQVYQPTPGRAPTGPHPAAPRPDLGPAIEPHRPQFKPDLQAPAVGPINVEQLSTTVPAAPPPAPSFVDRIADGVSETWSNIQDLASDAWSGVKDLASEAWSGVKDFASGAWDSFKDVASGTWQGFQNAVGWLGDKISENAQKDRPSILESRDAEKGIQSITAREAIDGIKDTLGLNDKPNKNSNQDDGESSAESRADRDSERSEPEGADRDGPGGKAV